LPKDANPDDSDGEILFLHRRFADSANAFLAAYSRDAAFRGAVPLRKAAEALRAAGQQAEADKLFARYLAAIPNRPLAPLEKAQWDYTSTGRADLAPVTALATRTNASAAWTQLSAWNASRGAVKEAADAAQRALRFARTPAERHAAAIAYYCAQPAASPQEWAARAAKMFNPPGNPVPRQALALALAMGQHWREAIPIVRQVRDQTPPEQADIWQPLLAIALKESGDETQAKTEARFAPIPRTLGDASWDFLIYPRYWRIQP
jgi:hypothetical protein